jgi:hypothetical protein
MRKTMNEVCALRTMMITAVLYDDCARDDHSAYIDMLKDIMHASHRFGLSFTNMLEAAKSHFDAEIHDGKIRTLQVRGAEYSAMQLAFQLAVFRGHGLFHSDIDGVLADADLKITELMRIAHEEEQFEFDELSADAQSQVRSNSGGMSDDDIIANGNTYDLSGNTL